MSFQNDFYETTSEEFLAIVDDFDFLDEGLFLQVVL